MLNRFTQFLLFRYFFKKKIDQFKTVRFIELCLLLFWLLFIERILFSNLMEWNQNGRIYIYIYITNAF